MRSCEEILFEFSTKQQKTECNISLAKQWIALHRMTRKSPRSSRMAQPTRLIFWLELTARAHESEKKSYPLMPRIRIAHWGCTWLTGSFPETKLTVAFAAPTSAPAAE